MRGYDERYTDIVDYIVRITDRIWTEQDVAYIYDVYRTDCEVYDDSSRHVGVERVVEHTVQSIDAFPDTEHYADDVIWAGTEDEGFATSHRAVNVGHHTGAWRWGAASGRRIKLWVIANCVSKDNKIYEEWVLYNTLARLTQCGVSWRTAARLYGNEDLTRELGNRMLTDVESIRHSRHLQSYPTAARGSEATVAELVTGLLHEAYNRRNLSVFDKVYASNVRWHGPSTRQGYGRGSVRAMVRGLLATFPDLALRVDEVYWMGNQAEGFSASVRWTAIGTHRGEAMYGPPTGRLIHLWGLSQLYISRGQVTEEWMLFNEFDVLAQILRESSLPLEAAQ